MLWHKNTIISVSNVVVDEYFGPFKVGAIINKVILNVFMQLFLRICVFISLRKKICVSRVLEHRAVICITFPRNRQNFPQKDWTTLYS